MSGSTVTAHYAFQPLLVSDSVFIHRVVVAACAGSIDGRSCRREAVCGGQRKVVGGVNQRMALPGKAKGACLGLIQGKGPAL